MNDLQLTLAPQSAAAGAAIQAVTALQRRGETALAKQRAEQLLQQFPHCVASLYLNVQLAMLEQDFVNAGQYLTSALRLQPGHPVLLLSQAQLALKQYGYVTAADYASGAIAGYDGSNMGFLSAIAGIMMQAEKPALAIPVYQRMLAVEPTNLQAMHQLALCYFYTNNITSAAEQLDKVIAKAPANAGAIHLRSALKTYDRECNHIEDLQQLVSSNTAHPAIYYALAKELEDIAEYKQSFAVLKQGAALMRKSINYNEAAELASINGIINTTANMAIAPGTAKAAGPIFIVGMPRTGTTLVERILSQHENVQAIGEFSLFPQLLATMANEYLLQHKDSVADLHQAALQLDFAELGRRYMAGATAASGGSSCVIDKLPVNFLYCGFIKKALPNARIIHLSRNAMDSCYAIYKTLFINAYSFSYDFNELANYYVTYRKIMAHWHRVMPGQIFDLQYEALVTDTEQVAKQLTAWCGLSYKAELLEFHAANSASTTASAAQIRKPIYTSSVNKWRNLETELDMLKVKLQQAGIEL